MKNVHTSLLLLLLLPALISMSGCNHSSSTTAKPPAEIKNPVQEDQLTTIKLTPQAEKRLGIQVLSAQNQTLAKSLTQHGEILAVPGFTVTVSAPFTGKLIGSPLMVGSTVQKGHMMFNITALPNDTSGLGAQQEVELRRKQLEVAQAQAKRYEQLYQEEATSKRLMQESQAALKNAQAAFNVAQSRQRFLAGNTLPSDNPQLSTMNIKAPLNGVIQKTFVTPNQVVSAGTPLFEVSSLNPVWVRVPVYAGDLSSVSDTQTAMIQPIDERSDVPPRAAHVVPGPPTVNPQAISTDLFFELSNHDNKFQVGQKVSVTLTQQGTQSSLTIPLSAIVYDIDGGTWVYQKVAPHTYARKRVLVSRVVKGQAVLAKGMETNAPIVSVGAAELFGSEFGAGK